MRNRPSTLRASLLVWVLAALIILGYTLYAALPFLSGPSLKVSEHTEKNITVITGKTERVSYLSIDGNPVPVEEDGSFTAYRAFPLGYTAVQVSVKDRFGRILTKTLTFLNT